MRTLILAILLFVPGMALADSPQVANDLCSTTLAKAPVDCNTKAGTNKLVEITDSDTVTLGDTVAGSGGNTVLAWCQGTTCTVTGNDSPTGGGQPFFHGTVGATIAVTGHASNYTLGDTTWAEVVDTTGEFAVGPADEVCYTGAGLTNARLTFVASFDSDGASANTTTLSFGVAATPVANGDETGEIWTRTHATASSVGMGSMLIVTTLATNDCIGILFLASSADDVTFSSGTLTVEGPP